MKYRKFFMGLTLLLVSAVSFQSCIGSFTLTNKVLSWNRNVSNKFVNELVFFAFWILPVYEVTAAADLLVINSIEFWSGNTPIEANNQVIDTENGRYYINAQETGYQIMTPDGQELCFDFDADSRMWSFSKNGADKTDFLKFKDDDHVEILDGTGNFVDVELTPEGVNDFKSGYLMAMK